MDQHTDEFVKAVAATILGAPGEVNIGNYGLEGLSSPVELYDSLPEDQQRTIQWMIRQTQIDTISEVFGILDGTSTLNGSALEADVYLDNESTEMLLQDLFLGHIQETEPGY